MTTETEIDCEGLLCPLPVLKAGRMLRGMVPGAVLALRATDPMAAVDLPHFCAEAGHGFLGAETEGTVTIYRIRCGGASPA